MTQTPIQQAIEYVEVQMKKWRRTDSIDSPIYTAYGIVRDRLEIMLRDEKEFVSKIWDASVKRTEIGDWTQIEESAPPPDKQQFIDKYYLK